MTPCGVLGSRTNEWAFLSAQQYGFRRPRGQACIRFRKSLPEERILTAKHAEYAEKWNSFAYFVCSAVLWPFYFGRNAQFLATMCKEAAETLNHGFHGWHGWGKGQDHETTGLRDYRTGAKMGEGAPEVRSRRSEVRGQSSEIS